MKREPLLKPHDYPPFSNTIKLEEGEKKPRTRVMSPIKSIAIIGAGPAGAIAVDALAQEQAFDTIRVFERREKAGGCWSVHPICFKSNSLPLPGLQTPRIIFNNYQTSRSSQIERQMELCQFQRIFLLPLLTMISTDSQRRQFTPPSKQILTLLQCPSLRNLFRRKDQP